MLSSTWECDDALEDIGVPLLELTVLAAGEDHVRVGHKPQTRHRVVVGEQRSVTSVGEPWHLRVDPDPRIRSSDYWIRIQLRIRLLSLLILRMQQKTISFHIFFLQLAHLQAHHLQSKNLIFC